ncbi:MAG: dihydropteroate synthase [Gemmatimonadaceae bacterium]
MTWRLAHGRSLDTERPIVIGILNVTPDSFSDGGRFLSVDAAVARAGELLAEGADMLDIGGESTRPGATPVTPAAEAARVIPVVQGIVARWPDVLLSVDTVKAEVAAAALDAGAHAVNDVSGFRLDPRMSEIAAGRGAGVVLMHSRGTVDDMATFAHAVYDDVVAAVVDELQGQLTRALEAGVERAAIVLDPGIGFAKRSEHSLRLLAELPRVAALGRPLLVGASRKRFIGAITGVTAPADRVHGSVGAHVAALARGARLFRVHDVRAHREALDVAWAVLGAHSAGADRQERAR